MLSRTAAAAACRSHEQRLRPIEAQFSPAAAPRSSGRHRNLCVVLLAPALLSWSACASSLSSYKTEFSESTRNGPGSYAADMFGAEMDEVADVSVPARRLAVSQSCMDSVGAMLNDKNWQFANNSLARWCRVRLENKMAACCEVAIFQSGRAEGCSATDCEADCIHSLYDSVCNAHFGRACVVSRPAFDVGAPLVKLRESFCVPSACLNDNDLQVVAPYFARTARNRQAGWQVQVDALIECPSMLGTILGGVFGGIVFLAVAGYASWYVFKAPYTKGRVMIDQEDFAEMTQVEDFDGTGQDSLRGTAQMTGEQPLQPLLSS